MNNEYSFPVFMLLSFVYYTSLPNYFLCPFIPSACLFLSSIPSLASFLPYFFHSFLLSFIPSFLPLFLPTLLPSFLLWLPSLLPCYLLYSFFYSFFLPHTFLPLFIFQSILVHIPGKTFFGLSQPLMKEMMN